MRDPHATPDLPGKPADYAKEVDRWLRARSRQTRRSTGTLPVPPPLPPRPNWHTPFHCANGVWCFFENGAWVCRANGQWFRYTNGQWQSATAPLDDRAA